MPTRITTQDVLLLLLLAGAVAVAGCQPLGGPTGALELWAAESDLAIFPDTRRQFDNEVFDGARNHVALDAAVNETVAFQLVLRARAGVDSIIAVNVSDFASPSGGATIPAAQSTIYRQTYVPVAAYPAWYLQRSGLLRVPREFPDALVPIAAGTTALPAPLSADRNQVFWIDLHVPRGTPPGTYHGTVAVSTRGQSGGRLDVDLVVWPFSLPDAPHVQAIAPLRWADLVAHHVESDGRPYRPQRLTRDDPLQPSALAVLDGTMRLLRDHRCHGILTDLHPLRRIGAGGDAETLWADYDAIVAGYLSGATFDDRVPVPVWPLPVDERYPQAEMYGGAHTQAYRAALHAAVAESLRHFAEHGWSERLLAMPYVSADLLGDEYAAYRAIATGMHDADAALRLWCDLPPQSMEPYGWPGHAYVDLSDLVNVWCPPARYADPSRFAALRKAGAAVWWQTDVPPYSGSLSVVSPPIDVRSIGWQATRWTADTVWLEGAADWPDPLAPGTTVDGATRWLIRPGREYGVNGPVPTVRLKHLLRGLQDAEYLWLVRQQDRPAVADLVAGSLFAFGGTAAFGEHLSDPRPYGWIADGAMWRLGRRLLAAELSAAAAGKPPADFEQFRQNLDWQRFLGGTHRVRAWVDGVRVRADASRPTAPLRAEARVSVINETTRTVAAPLRCDAVPDGWTVAGDLPALEAAPGETASRVVRLDGTSINPMAGGITGIVPWSIIVDGGEAMRLSVPARLAMLVAPQRARPIRVDGSLLDWPPGGGNVASQFVRVGVPADTATPVAEPERATEPTLALFCHDDDALYIAVNCQDGAMNQLATERTNFVRYEGLAPVGEDLIEIILDPGATASGPGDLYHIVVKANGAAVCERGFGCRPPIGPHVSWPADIQVAVNTTSANDRWFAEVRISWDSFAPEARRQAIWGMNVTRLHARLGEYSTWSGARTNAYSPTTLGTMWIQW